MSKVPLDEQIQTVEWALSLGFSRETYAAIEAAIATLKWVSRAKGVRGISRGRDQGVDASGPGPFGYRPRGR